MPMDGMSDETNLILTGQGLDAWAIAHEGEGPATNISIIWGGALDEEFLVRSEYAQEVVDHLANALQGNAEARVNTVIVMGTPVHASEAGVEATGEAAYERRVQP